MIQMTSISYGTKMS